MQIALLRCKAAGQVVLFTRSNPIGGWIERFAELLDVPHVAIALPDPVAASGNHRGARGDGCIGSGPCRGAIRLTAIDRSSEGNLPEASFAGLPAADLAVASLADQIWAIEVRPRSKTAAILEAWLSKSPSAVDSLRGKPQLFCFDDPCSFLDTAAVARYSPAQVVVIRDVAERRRHPRLVHASSFREACCSILQYRSSSAEACLAPLIGDDLAKRMAAEPGRYLVHCTRGRQGGFADQSPASYAAELLLSDEDIDGSPLESLARILRTGRITATSRLKRDAAASVSFADVPLAELLSRRRYQSHLRRWDWEPYGLAIRREALVKGFAAAAVRYLSPRQYAELPDEERWLFQPTGKERSQDWTREREWRCRCDVRLSKLDFADAVVFVATAREANLLRLVSPFAVLAVADA